MNKGYASIKEQLYQTRESRDKWERRFHKAMDIISQSEFIHPKLRNSVIKEIKEKTK